jgi:hypothetical protein
MYFASRFGVSLCLAICFSFCWPVQKVSGLLPRVMDTFFLVLVGYMSVFLVTIIAMGRWDKRKRPRKPFGEDIRLLRMPGEYLWRKVMKHDEDDLMWFFILGGLPIVAIGLALPFLSAIPNPARDAIAVALILTAFVICTRRYYKRIRERSNCYLGFFGERYVGEVLEPLKAKGWFIFHDVPFVGATSNYNLDHVAVGPTGVWVVETKTFRKASTRGKEEATVNYDGEKVEWPWDEDRKSVEQAARNVQSLRDWLEKQTGKIYPIAGVLTAPGYYVNERKLGAVRMVNPAGLPDVFRSRKNMELSPEDVDLIRRQLENKCRDIEY